MHPITNALAYLKKLILSAVYRMVQPVSYRGDVYVHKNGVLVFSRRNMVVDNGLGVAATAIFAPGTQAKVMCMGLGSNGRATVATDVALATPLNVSTGVTRKAFNADPNIVGPVVTMTTQFSAGECTGTVAEAGIFTDLTGNTMFARLPFPTPIPKGDNDVLTVTWVCTAVRP